MSDTHAKNNDAEGGKPDGASDGDDDRIVTFSEILGNREAAGLFGAFSLSTAGSMLMRVALTFLVFNATDSPFLATLAFGITYAPYLGFAQILGAFTDRFPYRTVMVTADITRAILIGTLAIPGIPVPVMLVIVFISAMMLPAYHAARTAMLPQVLKGEALSTALALNMTVSQASQLSGYFLGGVLAAINPHVALGLNAAAFAIAAIVVLVTVEHRPATQPAERKNLLAETADGLKLVFGDSMLCAIALAVFFLAAFTIVPEASAVLWADHLDGGAILQGTIMASAPLAAIISAIVFTRFIRPSTRRKLMKPMMMTAPLALVPAFFDPPTAFVIVIAVVCNLMLGGMASLNATFNRAVPEGYRGRTNTIMMGGLSLIQGLSIVGIGLVVSLGVPTPTTVGIWGVAGIIIMGLLLLIWPSAEQFKEREAQTA